MKSSISAIQAALLFLLFPLLSFADEVDDHAHNGESDAVAIDPVLVAGVVGVVIIGGFIIWKFFLRKK